MTTRRIAFGTGAIALAVVVIGSVVALGRATGPASAELAPRLLAVVRSDGLSFIAPGAVPQRVLNGSFTTVAWSSDGTQLAIADPSPADGSDPGIVILDVATRHVSRLTNTAPDAFAWSPVRPILASQMIGAVRGARSIEATSATGEGLWSSELPSDEGRKWREPLTLAWRPGGAWLVADFRRELNLCHETVVAATARPEHSASMFEDQVSVKDCAPHRPAWSSDGSRLAMLRTTEDCWPWRPSADVCGSDLVVYGLPFDLAGEHDPPARIATGVGSYQQPLWLPGDAELLFTRVSTTGSDPSVDVLIASASGAGVRRIGILKTGDPVVAWGVPGQSILYRVDQPTWNGGGPTAGDLRVFELPTGSDRLIAHDVLAAAFQPAP